MSTADREAVEDFLLRIARISEGTAQMLMEDQGMVEMADLLALTDDEVSQLCCFAEQFATRDKNRLIAALHKVRSEATPVHPVPRDGEDQNTAASMLPTHFVIQLEAKSPMVVGRLASATGGLVTTKEFANNLRELLTLPAERSAGAIAFRGAPFYPKVICHRDGAYESVAVEVCDPDCNAMLVLRVLGEHVDGTTRTLTPRQWPSPFDHRKLIDHNKIRIVCKQNESLETCELQSPVLHLFLVQLLGDTNNALPKMNPYQVEPKLRDLKHNIVVNDGDTMLDKVDEFVLPFCRAKQFSEVVHQGALLWGPAGGAKTTVARFVAECGFVVAFDGNLIALGNEFQNSASKGMINLFAFCRHHRHIPMLLLCDEIDRVVQKRDQYSSKKGGGGNEQENALSMLLALLTDKANQNVYMIGTTNKYHAIDEAAIRPGRIGLHIFVGRLSPQSAKHYVGLLFTQQGFHTAVSQLKLRVQDEEFVRMIFNLTGALIAHAVKAVVFIDHPPTTASWAVIEPLLGKRIAELRNPAVDPSSLVLNASKQHLTLSGAADGVRRAVLRQHLTPLTSLPILRSTYILNAATGDGFVAGNNHNFHVPLRVLERVPGLDEPTPIRQAALFSDVVGAICTGLNAVSVEVVNLSNLPEVDEIPAFAHQQGKMGEAGLRIVAIHMDNIVGVKIDRSEGKTEGTSEGEEKNFSVAKSVTDTKSEGTSSTTEQGYGTDMSKNASTTSGWSSTSGSSTEKGLFWDTDSVNKSQSSHMDATTGSSHGFNQHKSWSEAKTEDRSRAIGVTTTTGGSTNTGRSLDKSLTLNYSLEDSMPFRRLVNLVQELQHTPNVVVAVVSARRDSYTTRLVVQELAIEPPMSCAICHSNFHDPTRVLIGCDAVPCCTRCFDHASHRVGIDFDNGRSFPQALAVLNEIRPVLPLVQHIECCAVEGLLDVTRHQTVLRTLVQEIPKQCPSLSTFLFHGFGNYLPTAPGGLYEVQRRAPLELIASEEEKLKAHLQVTGLRMEDVRTLTGSNVVIPAGRRQDPGPTSSRPSTAPKRPPTSTSPTTPSATLMDSTATPAVLVSCFQGKMEALWAVVITAIIMPPHMTGRTSALLKQLREATTAGAALPDLDSTMRDTVRGLSATWATQWNVQQIVDAIVESSNAEDPAINRARWASTVLTTVGVECGECFCNAPQRQSAVTVQAGSAPATVSELLLREQKLPTVICTKCGKASPDTTCLIDLTCLPKVLLLNVSRPNAAATTSVRYDVLLTIGGITFELFGVVTTDHCFVNVTGSLSDWKQLQHDGGTNEVSWVNAPRSTLYLGQSSHVKVLAYRQR